MIRSLAGLFLHEGSKVERACVVSDLRGGEYFEELAAVLDELRLGPRRRPRPLPGGRRADAAHPLQGDPPAPPARPQRQRRRRRAPRAGAARADPRAGRHDHRHDGAERLRAAPQGRLGDARARRAGPARGHVLLVRPQARPGARRRHRPRRPLPARTRTGSPTCAPLTGFDAAVVDYVARDGRLREFFDRTLPLLEYLLPQYVAEGKSHLVDRHRLHGRPPPLRDDRRGARRPLRRRTSATSSRSSTATSSAPAAPPAASPTSPRAAARPPPAARPSPTAPAAAA